MKLVILDRDGVINQDSDDYIKSAEEWQPIPGSIEAIAALSNAGYTVAVATNQSGIARDYFDEFELSAMHQKMCSLVEEAGGEISGVFFCPHLPDEGCECRKPGIGLLKQMECEFGTSVEQAPFVGDSAKDLLAAKLAGCQPILVKTGKGERTFSQSSENELAGVGVYSDLRSFVKDFLNEA
ncbi:MAG: D-glycero-beta-D-manno-heptose 1,7-bisphosphate 7-phosphatase [Pseudohongiellaceae bacterium]|nr:D-glycero-beta-D-manno-heptose 1,7-bisphosphate 7-phosphatase [Pseudohongiellaceae bacterium]